MKIDIRFETPALKNYGIFSRVARALLEAVIMLNRIHLRTHPGTPPLYKSGVRYKNEPTDRPDEFILIPTLYARGWGDCAHLCAARVAELREAGEKDARIKLYGKPSKRDKNFRIFHVQVRRANGKIEDPSRILGMGSIYE